MNIFIGDTVEFKVLYGTLVGTILRRDRNTFWVKVPHIKKIYEVKRKDILNINAERN